MEQAASAPAVRPKEATAAEGIGEGPCREADNSGEPLVVDWKPEQRGDLELLMKENVAIVSYSCKGFKLLKDCKVDGNDCGVAGLVNIATGNPMGQSQIERACMQQDGLACAVKAANKK